MRSRHSVDGTDGTCRPAPFINPVNTANGQFAGNLTVNTTREDSLNCSVPHSVNIKGLINF